MQLNSRNFLLYLLSVAFLVIAIMTTYLEGKREPVTFPWQDKAESELEVEYSAVVQARAVPDRDRRLQALRDQIGKIDFSETLSAPVVTMPEAIPPAEAEAEAAGILLCSNYTASALAWPTTGVKLEVVEGARLVFTESTTPIVASSTEADATLKNVLLQLPLSSFPGKTHNCLPSPVVGVAVDGSLIRNEEVGLYSVFGAETLVGYALDGFPIYGAGEIAPDRCGGEVTAGEYRYVLSKEREVILNCFAGSPTTW
jgi:hypothetical protein